MEMGMDGLSFWAFWFEGVGRGVSVWAYGT